MWKSSRIERKLNPNCSFQRLKENNPKYKQYKLTFPMNLIQLSHFGQSSGLHKRQIYNTTISKFYSLVFITLRYSLRFSVFLLLLFFKFCSWFSQFLHHTKVIVLITCNDKPNGTCQLHKTHTNTIKHTVKSISQKKGQPIIQHLKLHNCCSIATGGRNFSVCHCIQTISWINAAFCSTGAMYLHISDDDTGI